jgi:hypothetical protein
MHGFAFLRFLPAQEGSDTSTNECEHKIISDGKIVAVLQTTQELMALDPRSGLHGCRV